MGCASCGSRANGTPSGCGSKGYCASGGCNRMNTYDWLNMQDIPDPSGTEIVEISYKQGARKEFCHCPAYLQTSTGDMVVIDEGNGYNIGRISLSGELVRLQMRKKRVVEDRIMKTVVRRTNTRDLERVEEARASEKGVMVRARAIARTLGVDLKIGDVEFRGDMRKATFYYTADGRVDFRELVRSYAREFKVKIEMRQIGARQESARIGGLGACGTELCCSTWLTDFKSVTTSAARYQNLSINQTKLSGQCGRLKCCLNYELDTYMDALKDFPKDVDRLRTEAGTAIQVKTDIFKRIIYYIYESDRGRTNISAVPVDRVLEIKAMNAKGEFPEGLLLESALANEEDAIIDYEDVTGVIELPMEKRRRKSRKRGGRNRNQNRGKSGSRSGQQAQGKGQSQGKGDPQNKGKGQENNKPRGKGNASGSKPKGQAGGNDQKKQEGSSKPSNNRRRGGRNRRRGGNQQDNQNTNKDNSKDS